MAPKKSAASSKQIITFLFKLWHISPVLTWVMVGSQLIVSLLTSVVAPLFVSQLLTHIANGSATLASSGWLLSGYAIVLFMGDVAIFRVTIAMSYITETKMQSIVSDRVLKHLSAKSLAYHSNRMSGGTVSDAQKLFGSIERFWDTFVYNITPIVTTIVAVCVALSFIYWQYAAVLAVLSIIIILVIIKVQSSIMPYGRKVAETGSLSTGYFADVITNIGAVKAFAREEQEQAAYRERLASWRQANMQEMRRVVVISASFGMMMTVLNIAAFAAAIYATQWHIAPIGATYLVISYTLNVVSQLWSVAHSTRSFIRILGDASPMISALEDEIEILDPVEPQQLRIKNGSIAFNKVDFAHDGNKHLLFDNFTLDIPAGQRVGLVGQSGSGKTSLTRLLLRFSDIKNGSIVIDGQDIRSITQADLHRSIAYVPQEPMLFHRSLRDNIAYGCDNASEKQIREAAKLANALEFIESLPDGFDTLVGERGVKLSGGQRQRVAIARAIIKDAPILLLDEATSALDSESERLIQDALANLMQNRTAIVVAHRLSTIAKLDRIIVLDNGKIVEDGTHSQLVKQGGTYAKLWTHQSGGFIEE